MCWDIMSTKTFGNAALNSEGCMPTEYFTWTAWKKKCRTKQNSRTKSSSIFDIITHITALTHDTLYSHLTQYTT